MEKKIEVEINGKRHRILPHMLEDFERFGATQAKRVIKNPPKEFSEPKRVILPPKELLPEMVITDVAKVILPPEDLPTEKPKRKAPVRSKSKK